MSTWSALQTTTLTSDSAGSQPPTTRKATSGRQRPCCRKSQSLTGLCAWAILYRVSHGKHGRCIVCLSVCVAENLPRKRTAGSDLTLAQASLVALLGVSSKARVVKWARAWKNLDKEIKDDLSRWVSGTADHFNWAVIQTQCAA